RRSCPGRFPAAPTAISSLPCRSRPNPKRRYRCHAAALPSNPDLRLPKTRSRVASKDRHTARRTSPYCRPCRHHDDSRYFGTWLVAWRQMKDGGKLLATVRDLCPFNLMVGKLHEFREGLPLLRVIALDAVVDLIDRPHR